VKNIGFAFVYKKAAALPLARWKCRTMHRCGGYQ
jgi:hypothetical protein